ncbi:MAG: glycosyltransferase family 4 protein [Traorella sp.]
MKILMITNHSYMFYQFRKELTQELLKKHEVVISTPFVGREEELRQMGCKLIETNVDRRGINPLKDLKLMKQYRQLILKEKPDKVITYSIKPNIYAGLLCSFYKIDYYVNVQGLGTAFQKKILSTLVSFLYKEACKKARVVFFENEGNAQEFSKRKILLPSKIKVLHGAGVNLDKYAYQEYENDDFVHFLFVGRIMKEKGVDELFEAIQRLKKKYQNVVLDMIGFFEDEYKTIVDELVQQNIVHFYGFQEDPKPFYKQAHCVVLASYHEGMSNVLLEASATGRAIITSDICGCKEAVDDHISGYLCNVKDANDLYEKMDAFMKLSSEERKQMGQKGRDKMIHEFDKKKIVEETMRCIMNNV